MTDPGRAARGACAALALLLSWGILGIVGAQPRTLEKLRVGTAGVEPGMGGLWMAKEAGFFAGEGLDVEFVVFATGTEGVQALLSGQLPVVATGGPSVVHAVLAGAEIRGIAELLGTMPVRVFASPEIRAPADLKGRVLGISKFGTVPDFALRLALTRWGLDPDRDVTLMQIGESAARLAALRGGGIAATVLNVSYVDAAWKLGLRELMDLGAIGLKFPYEVVAVPQRLIRDHPDVLRKFVRAIVLGTQRFKTRREDGIRTLGKYLERDDTDSLADTYRVFSKLIPDKPFVTPEGIQFVLNEIARTNPRAKGFGPAQFVDGRFVQELDESGFLDHPTAP